MKASHLYYFISSTVFITLALLAALIFLIDLIFPSRYDEVVRSVNFETVFAPTNYQIIGEQERREIVTDFSEYQATSLFGPSQIVGLVVPARHSGPTLLVDGRGRRQTVEVAPAGKEKWTAWIFGGSTAFGWCLSDRYTIASRLHFVLQSNWPERDVDIVNYGVPYGNSFGEAFRFAAFANHAKMTGERLPDLAIFIDGLNDLAHTLLVSVSPDSSGTREPTAIGVEGHRADLEAVARGHWLKLFPSFPIIRMRDSIFTTEPNVGAPSDQDSTARIKAAVAFTIRNSKLIHAAAETFGVKVLFVNQPQRLNKLSQSYENALSRRHPFPEIWLDLFDLLDREIGAKRSQYCDDESHYSDESTDIIVKQIAKAIR